LRGGACGEQFTGGFAESDVRARGAHGDFVEIEARLFGHAELSAAEDGVHVFGRVADQRDFEIVDQRGAVHGDSADVTAANEVNEHGREADLDHMTAEAPENWAALRTRFAQGGEDGAEIVAGKNVRERCDPLLHAHAALGRAGELAHGDFGFAPRKRIGADVSQRERGRGVDGHARSESTVNGDAQLRKCERKKVSHRGTEAQRKAGVEKKARWG